MAFVENSFLKTLQHWDLSCFINTFQQVFHKVFNRVFHKVFNKIALKIRCVSASHLVQLWLSFSTGSFSLSTFQQSFPPSFHIVSTGFPQVFKVLSTGFQQKKFSTMVFSGLFVSDWVLTNLFFYDIIIVPLLLPFVNSFIIFFYANVAQQVEQLTRNEQVVRSNRISSSRLVF